MLKLYLVNKSLKCASSMTNKNKAAKQNKLTLDRKYNNKKTRLNLGNKVKEVKQQTKIKLGGTTTTLAHFI